MTARIVGILLAAGAGARFGGGKLLAPLPASAHGVAAGTPIGAASARHLLAALGDVVAVVRPRDPQLTDALAGTGARVVECARADEGMGVSLAHAVAEVGDADGWVVALADMPWIAPATIDLVAAALRDGASLAAPAYRGTRGHPVGFAGAFGPQLRELTGDEGARSIVAAWTSSLRIVAVDDPGVLRDVDRPGDLR